MDQLNNPLEHHSGSMNQLNISAAQQNVLAPQQNVIAAQQGGHMNQQNNQMNQQNNPTYQQKNSTDQINNMPGFLSLNNLPMSHDDITGKYIPIVNEFMMDIYDVKKRIVLSNNSVSEANKLMETFKRIVDVVHIFRDPEFMKTLQNYNSEKEKRRQQEELAEKQLLENKRRQAMRENANVTSRGSSGFGLNRLDATFSKFWQDSTDSENPENSEISETEVMREEFNEMIDREYANILKNSVINKEVKIKRVVLSTWTGDNSDDKSNDNNDGDDSSSNNSQSNGGNGGDGGNNSQDEGDDDDNNDDGPYDELAQCSDAREPSSPQLPQTECRRQPPSLLNEQNSYVLHTDVNPSEELLNILQPNQIQSNTIEQQHYDEEINDNQHNGEEHQEQHRDNDNYQEQQYDDSIIVDQDNKIYAQQDDGDFGTSTQINLSNNVVDSPLIDEIPDDNNQQQKHSRKNTNSSDESVKRKKRERRERRERREARREARRLKEQQTVVSSGNLSREERQRKFHNN